MQTSVSKVMSVVLNMLSSFGTAFLLRSKHLLISWLQLSFTVILEPKKIKSVTISTFSPSICHQVMGADAMILVFLMLNFKPAFSLSSFTFIKRLFSSSSHFAFRVVLLAYRLVIFFLDILIPACASSSPAFHLIYSAYKLNKQGDDTQPCCTPLPMLNQPVVPSLVLTIASYPACIQVSQEVGKVAWYSHLFMNFPQFVVMHTKALA